MNVSGYNVVDNSINMKNMNNINCSGINYKNNKNYDNDNMCDNYESFDIRDCMID